MPTLINKKINARLGTSLLVDLKTDLKSLRYGNDQPGGGSSGLPYIQTVLPPNNLVSANLPRAYGNANPIFRIGSTGNLDYPIRGGSIDFKLGTQTFTLSSQIDKSRIKKFFEDKPRGSSFLQKQVGLQLTNPKIETGNSFQVVPGSNVLPGLLENTRIYNNGVNTLTQVGMSGTGTHLPRHGVFPVDTLSKYYIDIVGAQFNTNNSAANRLLILQKLKMSTNPRAAYVDPNYVNKLGISYNKNFLFQYLGGPGSVYGIGSTSIKRTTDTSKAASIDNFIEINTPIVGFQKESVINSNLSMTYDTIMSQNLNNTTQGRRTTNIQDYREASTSNDQKKLQTREEIYNLTVRNSGDKLNQLSSFFFINDVEPWNLSNDKNTKDLIKFVFEAINNDKPSESWAIFFRAMISGFTDNHQASINSFKYQGRGEDFYTYQGVSRAISFSFKIAVQSRTELQPLYSKLNHLISQVYPDYSEQYGVMRAPMIRLTIGDYIYRVAGMLENVNITIDDNAPWEINFEEDPNIKQLPQVINVQCSFKPIQDFLPRRETLLAPNSPFITDQSKDYLEIENTRIRSKAEDAAIKAKLNADFVQDRQNLINQIDRTIISDTAKNTNLLPNRFANLSDKFGLKVPKYAPPKKVNPFETTLEKDWRTGNFFDVFRSDR